MKYKAGFIGVGNMGSALLCAVSSAILGEVAIYDTDETKVSAIVANNNAVSVDIDAVVSECEFIFLGVKPNIISNVAKIIKNKINEQSIIVSMAAGIDLDFLSSVLNTDRIIRIMPNTPVLVKQGMVLFCTASGVSDVEIADFNDLMKNVGKLDYIDEKLIDAAAALSGCGPALVYMFAEALADGAVKCGLPRDKALLYAKQTILGSAALMIESNKHPEQLKDEVCSPGGTTIEGVLALEKGSFRYNVASAVTAAYEKTSKLKS